MAFYMDSDVTPGPLFDRCLPNKELEKNSEEGGTFTYEVTGDKRSNGFTPKKNPISYYEPAKHRDAKESPFGKQLVYAVEPIEPTVSNSGFNPIDSYSLIEHDGKKFSRAQKIKIRFGERRINYPQEVHEAFGFSKLTGSATLKVQLDGKSSGGPDIPQSKDLISSEIVRHFPHDFHKSDDDAWVSGTVLLDQYIVNVNTDGDPTTYQILPVKRCEELK
ncbi:hypothetical protein ABG067_006290 [Albugo candida]